MAINLETPGLEKHLRVLDIANKGKALVYTKEEKHFGDIIYRKTKSITINAHILAGAESGGTPPDIVRIHYKDAANPEMEFAIEATRKEILAHARYHEHRDELKWEYPASRWALVSGEANWKKFLKVVKSL